MIVMSGVYQQKGHDYNQDYKIWKE